VFILHFIFILTVTGLCGPVVSIPALYRQGPGFECYLEIGCSDRLFFFVSYRLYRAKWYAGCVVAQVVSCWLPTVAAWVQAHVRSCGICGGQSGTGPGFLQVLRFPPAILISQNAPYSSVIWFWYNSPISGQHTKWAQPHPHPTKLNKEIGVFDELERI
jgi:hypothetical protein